MAANDRQEGGLHYRSEFQHWDLIERHGIGYLEGCATKYLTRWRKKNGVEDLKKALHYVEKLEDMRANHGRRPRGSVEWHTLAAYFRANGVAGEVEQNAIRLLVSQWTFHELKMVCGMIEALIQKHVFCENG